MKLYYTPISHFSRKVRILLAALGHEVELIDAGNVVEMCGEHFGPNPLMKVPTLIDNDAIVFDSDHIAQYIIRQYDPFNVMTNDVQVLNARAVMNGIMSGEVELILAQRTGIDIRGHARFDKIKASIHQGLQWLEDNTQLFEQPLCYLSFHLIAMWDHLLHYQMVAMNYHRLLSIITKIAELDCVKASAPQRVH